MARRRHDMTLRPGLLLVLGLVGVILTGGLLLSLPFAAAGNGAIAPLDALFTSTSAACVTGLITRDTAVDFSPAGQAVILLLIQIGGLGVMSASGLISLLLGRGLGVREAGLVRDLFDTRLRSAAGGMLRRIVELTLAIEVLGAVLLHLAAADRIPDPGARAWWSLFHSVSAFCNAGFSLESDSLISVAGDAGVMGVISALLILGGLGFAVIINTTAWLRGRALRRTRRGRVRPVRLGVQARVIWRLTGLLLLGGMALLLLLERQGALAGAPWGERLALAWFQSATCRTAGFNSMDLTALGPASLLVMMVLMAVGAAPGSTAGGLKLTTVAILYANLRSIVLGSEAAVLFDREVPRLAVRRAFMVLTSWLLAVTLGLGVLLAVDAGPFAPVLFEVISALGTVGLSLGLTPTLPAAGKVMVILLMFLGRLGPLAVAYGLVRSRRGVSVRYPETDIMVG
ncbi:MAG TPA: potassium transporter TrkG [Candidatus Krumholzibacteria bacterium]|nr:potassium transporter TrkG [Candidatus Krumholzibacteria bacterium]HRX50348.1 potassium transporter TrkG [Candidatus Krumholzibacteria bacterium]